MSITVQVIKKDFDQVSLSKNVKDLKVAALFLSQGSAPNNAEDFGLVVFDCGGYLCYETITFNWGRWEIFSKDFRFCRINHAKRMKHLFEKLDSWTQINCKLTDLGYKLINST